MPRICGHSTRTFAEMGAAHRKGQPLSCYEIADLLNAAGVTTPTGKKWTGQLVSYTEGRAIDKIRRHLTSRPHESQELKKKLGYEVRKRREMNIHV